MTREILKLEKCNFFKITYNLLTSLLSFKDTCLSFKKPNYSMDYLSKIFTNHAFYFLVASQQLK